MSGVVCTVCGGNEFQIEEGLHYCRICLTQSQQHGLQMELDNDATFHQNLTAKKKKISTKKKRRKTVHYSSYSTLDAFTFILRGWTEEAELLGIIGPSFKLLLRRLLKLYLHKLGRAFTKKPPTLGVMPQFRDVQVALTGRSKLHVFGCGKRKKKKESEEELSDDPDDLRKASQRRKRRRTDFLKSLLSDDEQLTEPDSEATTEDDDPLRREEADVFRAQNEALESAWSRVRASRSRRIPPVYDVTLLKFFSIFSLALLTQNRSQVTLGDVVHLAQCGSLSLANAGVHLHSTMVLQGISDFSTFSYSNLEGLYRLLRLGMTRLAKLLDLGVIDFGSPLRYQGNRKGWTPIRYTGGMKIPLLERYVKELSLPQGLAKTIQIAFKHTSLLEELQSSKRHGCPDVSQRVLAVILVVLKYIYGLDDFTEDYISSTFKLANRDSPLEKQRFVIRDWIRLSRFRVFLMMKFSSWFHRKFISLMPRRRLSHPTYISEVREGVECFRQMRRGLPGWKDCGDAIFDRLDKFLLRTYGENLPPPSGLYLGETLTPMLKFGEDVLCGRDFGQESLQALPQESKDKIRQLMDMNKMRLGMRKSIANEESLEIDVPILESSRFSYLKSTKDPHFESTGFKRLHDIEKSYVFKTRSFRQSYFSEIKGSHSHQVGHLGENSENKCLAELPDSYTWILKYFSAYYGGNPVQLHGEVNLIEASLLKLEKGFFGRLTRSVSTKGKESVTLQKATEAMDAVLAKYVEGYKP